MSNIIPPLLSNSPPPPPPSPDEEDDDEFGDFTGPNDCSYGCDNLSLPSTPEHSPTEVSILNGLDINFNGDSKRILYSEDVKLDPQKDFQDKRKCDADSVFAPSLSENSTVEEKDIVNNFNDLNIKKEIMKPLEDLHNDSSESDDGNVFQKTKNLETSTKNEINEIHYDQLSFKRQSHETGKNSILSLNVGITNSISSDVTVIPIGDPDDSNETSNSNKNVDDEFGDLTFSHSINIESEICLKKDKFEQNCIKQLTILEKLNPTSSTGVQNEELMDTDIIPAMSTFNMPLEKHIDITLPSTEMIQCQLLINPNCQENIGVKFEAVNFDDVGDLTLDNVDSINSDEKYADHLATTDAENFPENIDITSTQLNLGSENFDKSIDDDFGNFEFVVTTPHKADTIIKQNMENVGDEYTFGDLTSDNIDACSHISSENDFGEFANFSSHEHSVEHMEGMPNNPNNCDNNSDDFGDFTSTAFDSPNTSRESEDFGNFARFPELQEPVLLLLDEKQAFEKANEILKEMFPIYKDVHQDFESFAYEKKDFIFNELQDITDTPALGYQWSKSASQKMLLMSLNIDARNILYGPSWNPSMPRFAANLRIEPLEPVKTECLSPSVQKSSPSPSVPTLQPSVDIPSVQFDWNSSGLTNPLDSVSKDSTEEEPLESSPNPATSGTTITSSVLKAELVPTKVTSKTDLEEKSEDFDDFHDFTSFQPSTVLPVTKNWPNTVPLRETYISNDNMPTNSFPKELPLDVEAWLQPTIVTPELPRKRSNSQEEELPNICTPGSPKEKLNIEDDFDDFQMVLPESKTDELKYFTKSDILPPIITPNNKLVPDISKISLSRFDTANINSEEMSFPPNIDTVSINTASTLQTNAINIVSNTTETQLPNSNEDTFTDFHFSTPVKSFHPPKFVTTILEPLKPIPVYSSAVPIPSTQIDWPDPGMTDEELKKFDDIFSHPVTHHKEETKQVKDESKTIINDLKKTDKIEDDEWTEFVSVQKPSPVHKVRANKHERTASPDLPLSVFNLGYIQPTKQPIPVITPQGILQTKLSSNPAKMSPKATIKSNVISAKSIYQTPPSIISQQYASQAYGFNKSQANMTRSSANQKNFDDDEWGEFVSSPLPAQSISVCNGYQQPWHNNSSQHYGMRNSSPNIIMNPRHFVQSGSDGRKVPNMSLNRKSTVPNLVLPELDFVAPKVRTSSTRKK